MKNTVLNINLKGLQLEAAEVVIKEVRTEIKTSTKEDLGTNAKITMTARDLLTKKTGNIATMVKLKRVRHLLVNTMRMIFTVRDLKVVLLKLQSAVLKEVASEVEDLTTTTKEEKRADTTNVVILRKMITNISERTSLGKPGNLKLKEEILPNLQMNHFGEKIRTIPKKMKKLTMMVIRRGTLEIRNLIGREIMKTGIERHQKKRKKLKV